MIKTRKQLIKANPTFTNNRKTDAYGRDIIIIKPGDKVVIPEKASSGAGGNAGGSKPDHGYGPEYRKPDAEKSGPLNDNRKPESEQKQGEAGSANDEFWWCDSGGSGLCVASTEDAKRAEESLREGARKIGSIIIAGESLAIEQLEKLFDKLEQINPKFASHLKENAAIIADYINAASEYAVSKIPDSIKNAYEAFLAGTTLEERKLLLLCLNCYMSSFE